MPTYRVTIERGIGFQLDFEADSPASGSDAFLY